MSEYAASRLGETLDRYRLEAVLGEGGFGQVLEVIKRDCGRHYAMKVSSRA